MSEQPPGGYPPPQPPQGGGYPPPQPPQGGGYPPPPPEGYPPPQPPSAGGYSTPPPPPQGGQGGGYPPPPPPQSGGYPPPPPPQSGGYPPPAGGYPPAGGPGYGGYGGDQPFNIGDAFSWAWNKFTKNAGPLVVATLIYALVEFVVIGVLVGLTIALTPQSDSTSYDGGFSYSWSVMSLSGIVMNLIFTFVLLLVAYAIQSAYISGILDIANGREVTVGSFLKPRNVGNVLVAALIVSAVVSIGNALCYIPGLIASFFLMFTIVALLDRNLSPLDAIKNSFETAKNNIGNALIAWLVIGVTAAVGAFLCGVGLLVAIPVASLLLVYTYRRLSGGQVALPTP